ncbi:hypothetical protein [Caulobacter sp. 17J80-11]|uniref:hypothetical protein n=1 Tax=Caulobacter sp. 17J80-11 TaxID=2763502 RepID=UPI001653B63A|nr:hypothetical protein [Caulobacter sp. 17J80-11]MBC6981282.1 hypothetical protein [Caulobacter sp. 17J80-11]
MRVLLLAAAAGAALLSAAPALAAPPTEAQWTGFLKDSYEEQHDKDDPVTWETRLYRAGLAHADRQQALAVFAGEIGVPVETAEAYAEMIMAVVIARDAGCEAPETGCALAPGLAVRDLVERVALAEPTGELLRIAGFSVGTREGSQTAAFVELAQRHPRGGETLAALFDYAEDPIVLGALALRAPTAPTTVEALWRVPLDVSGGPEKWGGWQEAVLENAEARALAGGASVEVQAAYAQARLLRTLALGLSDDAVALWTAYPEAVRARLPLAAAVCGKVEPRPCEQASDASYRLADDLAAALWAAGRTDEARAVLARAKTFAGPRSYAQRQRLSALTEAMTPTLADADLFTPFIEGGKADGKLERHEVPRGWLFSLDTPAVRRLVAARLEKAGYAGMVRFLTRDGPYGRWETDPAELNVMDALLDADTKALRLRWAARIDAAWAKAGAPASRIQSRLGSPERAFTWRETRLPDGVGAWGEKDAPELPKDLKLPVPLETVGRYERTGSEQAVLFASSDYDLPGEIPAFGMWLARTENGAWKPPVYLGLQQSFPYVVTPGSAVPLLEGDRVRIEVNVREIDPASISFPPVGLTIKRHEEGVVLEASLAELERDGDADGLTDAAERRLGLDPANPDSDGDGLKDGADPIPAVARKPAGPGGDGLAAAVVKAVFHHDAGAIMVAPRGGADEDDNPLAGVAGGGPQAPRMNTVFLVAPAPSVFAGLDLPFRLMVYTPEQAAALPTGGAPFFPPQVTEVLSSLDGRRHYVVWSAGWVGGSFLATCPAKGNKPCKVKEVEGWIS